MSEGNLPFFGPNGIGNEFMQTLLSDERFLKGLEARLPGVLAKADTISNATNLLWYDLSQVVQMLYPYRELIPCISKLPRTPADGGNAYHWKRIVNIDPGNTSGGVSEGNRGARIGITEQDMTAKFSTMGFENSVTFEARLGARNLRPEVLGIATQSTLRRTMIFEEQILINGNASTPLGTTPTPSIVNNGSSTGGSLSGTVYINCVAMAGMGFVNYRTYNSAAGTGGLQGQITRINADGSSDTFGGGTAAPSVAGSLAASGANTMTATVTPVPGAAAYAWYVGSTNPTTNGYTTQYLAGITPSNQVIITKIPASTNQPLSALLVNGNFQDNSTNVLCPDGVINQINGAILGPSPGQAMATNPILPNGVSLTSGGALLYQAANGNTGLTVAGSNINEFDAVLRAGYDQYKVGFDRILMSSVDMLNSFGVMLTESAASNIFRILFDAEKETGRIVAGRKVTSYMNKWYNNTLDVEVHPFVPPGTVIFWSDRSPYELSDVANLLEARVRQDYYQVQWPWRSRRYEYGVYVDETFPLYFTPAFALLTNLNGSSGNMSF